MSTRVPVGLVVAAVVALLALALLASAGSSPVPTAEPDVPVAEATTSTTVTAQDGDGPAPAGRGESTVGGLLFGGMLAVVGVLALLGLAVLLGSRWELPGWHRRDRDVRAGTTEDPGLDVDEGGLRAAVRSARDDLDRVRAEGRPGDAVVAAWARLEEVAADAGAARAGHQTPTEFTTALLERALPPAAAGPVAALRERYHRARFSTAPVPDGDAAAAAADLDLIEAALDAAAVDPSQGAAR